MAEFQFQCKVLLKLLPLLECHNCKSVPGPNRDQKRYSCFNYSHSLCEEHKAECPCGSLVGKNPSPFIATILQDMPWICQYSPNGCREIKMDVEELADHQQNCKFRQVFCPYVVCKREKVLFKNVAAHVEKIHKNCFDQLEMSERGVYKWIVKFDIDDSDFEGSTFWKLGKITGSDGDVFYAAAYFTNNIFHIFVNYFGSPNEARKFSCTCSIRNMLGEKFLYTGQIQTLDEKKNESVSLLKIGHDAVKRSLDEEKKLCVKFTIKNLKEANNHDMESGVSEGDPLSPMYHVLLLFFRNEK